MLTHEEAYLCRLFVEDPAKLETYATARRFFLRGQTLTFDQVEQLLADYNTEYVVVRRADVRAVIEAHESGDCGNYFATEAANFRGALEAAQ